MKQITSYGFDIDTACVELRFSDDSTIAIDTIAVENEFAETWLDRRELDYLIYNDPLGYADLVLNGDATPFTEFTHRNWNQKDGILWPVLLSYSTLFTFDEQKAWILI